MKQKTRVLLLFLFLFKSSFAQQNSVDSLKILLSKSIDDTAKVNLLNRLAFKIVNDIPDSALLYSTLAYKLAKKLNFELGLADALNMNGLAYCQKGDYKLALENHHAAIDLQRQLKENKSISNSLNNIGNVYLAQGEFDKALDFHFQSLNIEKGLNNKNGIASSLDNIGLDYESKGDYDKALDYHLQCLRFLETEGSKKEIADSYSNIGNVYIMNGNYDKALDNHFKALKLRNEVGDKHDIAFSLTNLGNIYNDKLEYSNALNYYLQAEPMLRESGDKKAYAALISNIGVTYYYNKNLRKAIELIQKSMEVRESIGDKEGIAACYINIGNTEVEMKNYSLGISNLKKGISIGQEINSLSILMEGYEGLSTALSQTNDFKNALHYFKLLAQTKDSTLNQETNRNITELQTKYETEKKDKEIAQLGLDKEVIVGSRKRIIYGSAGAVIAGGIIVFLLLRNRKTKYQLALNSTENKVLRSQMNPHFIFNSLNSIDDYIHNNDIQNSSLYINKFSRLVRMILESSRMEEISLKEDLEALELYIQLENLRMKIKVAYTINLASDINSEKILIPPMLLQPFVENAFKHAYEGIENPTLEVKIFLQNEMLHCSVIDNGSGRLIKQDTGPELKAKNESLGLRVTLERLDIINKIKKTNAFFSFTDLTNDENRSTGTKVDLALPLSYAF